MKLPDELTQLLHEVPALSRAYLVGGCVRDSLLGISHKDFDLEVYGVDYEKLEQALSPHGRVDLVGKSFGIIKFTGQSGGQGERQWAARESSLQGAPCTRPPLESEPVSDERTKKRNRIWKPPSTTPTRKEGGHANRIERPSYRATRADVVPGSLGSF